MHPIQTIIPIRLYYNICLPISGSSRYKTRRKNFKNSTHGRIDIDHILLVIEKQQLMLINKW